MDYIQPKEVGASGPYTPVVKVPPFVFISGQGTREPKTGVKYLGVFSRQVEIAMTNLKHCADAAGLDMNDLTKVTVYVTDIKNLAKFNEIYPRFFKDGCRLPARTAVAVLALPGGMDVEIDAIGILR